MGTPFIIHQPSYSMINRWVEEDGLLDTLEGLGVGSIVFSPLAQGMLTAKYLGGIPEDSRAAQGKSLRQSFLNEKTIANIQLAQRHRRKARPDAGADGARLGAARRPRHLGADRRQPPEPGRGLRRRARRTSNSAPRSLPRSTATRTEANINLWAKSAEREGPPRK